MIVTFRDVAVAAKRDAFFVAAKNDARTGTTISVGVVFVVVLVFFGFFGLTVDTTQNAA